MGIGNWPRRGTEKHRELKFQLTPIGALAGYLPAEIAPLFAASPLNVIKPPEFAS